MLGPSAKYLQGAASGSERNLKCRAAHRLAAIRDRSPVHLYRISAKRVGSGTQIAAAQSLNNDTRFGDRTGTGPFGRHYIRAIFLSHQIMLRSILPDGNDAVIPSCAGLWASLAGHEFLAARPAQQATLSGERRGSQRGGPGQLRVPIFGSRHQRLCHPAHTLRTLCDTRPKVETLAIRPA